MRSDPWAWAGAACPAQHRHATHQLTVHQCDLFDLFDAGGKLHSISMIGLGPGRDWLSPYADVLKSAFRVSAEGFEVWEIAVQPLSLGIGAVMIAIQ